MEARVSDRLATTLLWVAPAFISSNYIIAKVASTEISPHLMALLRWTVALLIMAAVSGRRLGQLMHLPRREYGQLLILGALGMWICGAFVYQAALSTSSTNIALIYAVTPIAIAAINLGSSHFRLRHWAGMLLAFLGLVFVIAKGQLTDLAQVHFSVGDGWILVAGASWVAYTLLTQRWNSALASAERLCAVTLGGLVVLLPFTMAETAYLGGIHISGKGFALAVLAGIVPGFIAYKLYSFLIHRLGPAKAGLVMYLSPVYAALIAWAVLGERPSWYHVVGALAILPGIYLVTAPGKSLSPVSQP